MLFKRVNHSVVRLSDGKLLVSGGRGGLSSAYMTYINGLTQKSIEIYDPDTRLWTQGKSMSIAREFHSSVRLNDGKVLVIGGYNKSTDEYLNTMEIYDPQSNTWNQNLPNLQIARSEANAFLINSNKVIIVGGKNQNSQLNLNAEIFNITTNTISLSSSMPYPIYYGKSVLINNQFIFYIGQNDSNKNKILKYDILNDIWSEVFDLNQSNQILSVSQLNNDTIAIILNEVDTTRTILKFNINTNTINATHTITSRKYNPSIVQLYNSQIFTVGGDYGTWELF